MTEEQASHPLQQYRGERFVNESGEARIPTPAEFEDARFAPGTAADLPYAVLYQGEFETPWDGTGTAVRRHARALASTGLPVKLTSISHVVVNEFGYPDPVHEVGLPREIELEVGDLCKTNATGHVPVIKHAVVRNAEHAHNLLVPRGAVPPSDDPLVLRKLWRLVAGSTILYSVWERDRVDVETVRELNRAGQLWVPCRQNAEMLVSSGVDRERVFVVPHPYDPDDDLCKVAALKRLKASEHAHGWRLFYSIGRWEPRKGYAELIEAFLRAFTPDDRVKLTIKYTGGEWQGYPTPTEAVARALAAAPHWTAKQAAERIVLLSGRGPRTGIIELHYRNNIYVASSHGEAWCLPAFEARMAGNALVAVPYGGMCDFMPADGDPALSIVEPSGLEPVDGSYRWPEGSEWCAFSVEALGEALRRAQAPKQFQFAAELGQFEMRRVGVQMRDLVLALASKVKEEAAEFYKGKLR